MYYILYTIHIGGRVGVVRCQGWGGQGAEGGHRLIPTPLLRDEDRDDLDDLDHRDDLDDLDYLDDLDDLDLDDLVLDDRLIPTPLLVDMDLAFIHKGHLLYVGSHRGLLGAP